MGRRQPKLLLLDELDAVLHPSMISALIFGLKDQFVSNGTRVVMATHSVTTVSMLEEGEVFRIARTGNRVDVQGVARVEAVDELSEGLATIEAGLRIATSESAAPVTILTEGNNVIHLKKWTNLFFGNRVEIFDKLPDRTGKNELCSYGRLLAKMEGNTHFLIVWDCDASKEVGKLRNEIANSTKLTLFAFSGRENEIAPKGIENNYDERYLTAFATTSSRATTGATTMTIANQDKIAFAKHVSEKGTRDYFIHFGDLEKVVQEILGRLGVIGSGPISPREET